MAFLGRVWSREKVKLGGPEGDGRDEDEQWMLVFGYACSRSDVSGSEMEEVLTSFRSLV